MLYQINHGSVSRQGRTILSDFDFEIRENEKIAVTGDNGSGKTTLLLLIAGELEPDRNDRYPGSGIRVSRAVTIDLLRQVPMTEPQKTVEQLMLEAYACSIHLHIDEQSDAWQMTDKERYDFEMEYDRIFTGFGFQKTDKNRPVSEFSGGEQTKIALIRLLLKKPDILLLDEPTNHLDTGTVEWLEAYLRDYPKAVIMVSHDRFFLDRTAQIVYEVRDGKLTRYVGNYTSYCETREKQYEINARKYREQQLEIERLNDLIKKFRGKPRKASFAQSRKKLLERMERMEQPVEAHAPIRIPAIQPEHPGSKWVWESEDACIGYDQPLAKLTLRIKRGQKLGVIGPNGCGKTTLLRTIAGRIELLNGESRLGNGIELAYFDQQSAAFTADRTVLDHFRERFPILTEKDARQILGTFGLGGKMASSSVTNLSGGERSKLLLLMLLQSKPNVLILDEPTNHLDIRSIEMLEAYLRAYDGTLIVVSHDRDFLQRVTESLVVMGDGLDVLYYPFGYEHYISRKGKASGQTHAALRTAEEQAMIDGLHAVPEREKGMLRKISDDSWYHDWRYEILQQEMQTAVDQWQGLLELRETETWWTDPEECCAIEQKIQNAEKQVTALMIQEYELWLDFHDVPGE